MLNYANKYSWKSIKKDGIYIAQEKFDGHRAIMYCKGGKNYFFSRRTSDVTGDKEDNTDKVPYLRDLDLSKFEDSIFDFITPQI